MTREKVPCFLCCSFDLFLYLWDRWGTHQAYAVLIKRSTVLSEGLILVFASVVFLRVVYLLERLVIVFN